MSQSVSQPPKMQRTTGRGEVTFRKRDSVTVLDHLFQEGAAKIRLPRTDDDRGPTAVMINTAGGLTGGDQLSFAVEVKPGGQAIATTQAQEKVYKSIENQAEMAAELRVGAGATLHWLPQEAILFDKAHLRRRVDVDLEADASFLGVEAMVFGRYARGEVMQTGTLRESWRVRREGQLVFADETRLDDTPHDILSHAATANGQTGLATLVFVGDDLEPLRDSLRALEIEDLGISIVRDVLVIRLLAPTGAILRQRLIAALMVLRNGDPLPRVWHC